MSILQTINNSVKTVENSEVNIDSASTVTSEPDANSSSALSGEAYDEPSDYSDDLNSTNKLDDEIDSLREIGSKLLAPVFTIRDIMKSDFNKDISSVIFDITNDLFSKLVKTKYIDSSILTLQQMQQNNFKYEIIPNISDNPKSYGYIVAIAFPTIDSSIDEFPNIDFDKINKNITNFNNIIKKVDSRNYLMMINSFIIPYIGVIRKYIKQLQLLEIPFKNDLDNIVSDSDAENIINIFNFKTNMIAISNTYRIHELSDILFPLNHAIQYNYNWIDPVLMNQDTFLYRRINHVLQNIPNKYLDENLTDLKEKLNHSDIYSKDLTNFSAFIYTLQSMSESIKLFSSACGIVLVKKGQTRSKQDFIQLKSLYKELLETFDSENIRSTLQQIKNLIDPKVLDFRPQVGMLLKPITSPSLGFDQEFLDVLKTLIDIKEHYRELLDNVNFISTENSLFQQYLASYIVGYDIKKYIIELNKILNDFNSDTKVIDKINKIIDDLEDHKDDLIYVTDVMKKIVATNDIDNIIEKAQSGIDLFHYMKQLNDIVINKKLEKKYNINLEDLGNASYNREYIKKLLKQIDLFEDFAIKLYTAVKLIKDLITKITKLYNTIYKYRFELLGYNNISTDIDFNKFDFQEATTELLGFLLTSPYHDKINHKPFKISNDDILNYQKSITIQLNSIYHDIQKIANKYGLSFPTIYNACTEKYLSQFKTKNITSDEKEIITIFKQLKTLEQLLLNARPIDASFTFDEVNEKIEYINFAISNAIKYTEDDLKNRLYFAEEFKNEIESITKSINKKYFSDDINQLLYKTPPAFTIGNKFIEVIGFLRSYRQLLESAYYFIDNALQSFGNYDQFIEDLSKSASIKLSGNKVWFDFTDEDISTFKLYSEQILMIEDKFNTVLKQFTYFMKNIKQAIIEYEYTINLAKLKSDNATNKNFSIIYKNIDLLPNDNRSKTNLTYNYHKVHLYTKQEELFNSKNMSIIDYDLISESLNNRAQQALNIQYTIPQYIKDDVFYMRSKIISYQENSPEANTYSKIAIKNKREDSLFNTVNFSEQASTPIILYKEKVEPLLTYEGQDSNYTPYVSNGVYYNTLQRVSKDYAIHITDYLITTKNKEIKQLVKVFRISSRVYGGFSAKLIGYGYLDGKYIKYTTNLKNIENIQLYDNNNLENKLIKNPYKIGYSNSSHLIILNGKKYNPFVYGSGTLLGLVSEDGNVLIKDNNTDQITINTSASIGVEKYITLDEVDDSFRIQSFKGINSELNNSYSIKSTNAFGQQLNVVYKEGMYKVDSDNIYYHNIFGLYGNQIEKNNPISLKLANNETITAYRIISPSDYLLTDYFLVTESKFIPNHYRLISPQMLSSSESIFQEVLDSLNNKYSLFDKYSEKLKLLLNLDYNPSRAITSINRYPYIYMLTEKISIDGSLYNKVVNIHGEYVGFTNGVDVIFDILLEPNNTILINTNYNETIFTTETYL